jgi:glycosyltransferase involved in cell wall biosynthesis
LPFGIFDRAATAGVIFDETVKSAGEHLRVAVVADDLYPGYGGQASAMEGHVEALLDLGHQVRVLAGQIPKDRRKGLAPAGVLVDRLPVWRPRGKQIHFALPSAERVRRLLRWADVVHVNTMTPLGLQVLGLARRLGVPSVLGFHAQEENLTLHLGGPLRPPLLPALRGWYRLVCGRADAVVAPTSFAASYARRYTRPSIHVVSNGIRLPKNHGPTDEARNMRRRLLGAGNGRFLISYVGRLDPEKRPEGLLEVASATGNLRRGDGVVFAVAGSGSMRPALEERAAESGISRSVRFLGYVSEVEKDALLRASDLFLMPSPTELQNIATLEAMARGCAVAAAGYPTSAVPSVVGEADCGFSYDPDDPSGAARAVSRLLDDEDDLRRLQRNALRAAEDLHDVRESGRRLEVLYRTLLSGRAEVDAPGRAPATGAER